MMFLTKRISAKMKDRAEGLVAAASKEHQVRLTGALQAIRNEATANGMFTSSRCANLLFGACASDASERANTIWSCMQRAHKSLGASRREDLPALFSELLEAEVSKVKQLQEEMTSAVVAPLQNSGLQQLHLLDNARTAALAKYQVEIAIYDDDLRRGSGANLLERIKNLALNNRLVVALVVTAAAIALLFHFAEGLHRVFGWFSGYGRTWPVG